MMQRLASGVMLLLLLAQTAHTQPEPRAWLDRERMHLGETVTLTIEIDGEAERLGDQLAALLVDFEVLGRTQSSRVQMSGGGLQRVGSLALTLAPRRGGLLAIPPLPVAGGLTPTLQLTVDEAPQDQEPPAEVFIEAELDATEVYVQQTAVLTVRLYYAVTLTEGSLSLPSADRVVVDALGNDRGHSVLRDGRRYEVLERRYLLTPEGSGVIEFEPARFIGRAVDAQRGGFFGRGRSIEVATPIPALRVRPRPSDSGSGPWLPARRLEFGLLGAGWPQQVRVGEPFLVELRLAARGLAASQLPDPELALPAGLRAYPEAARSEPLADPHGVAGQRLRGFALVATRPGRVEIPEQRLEWWDLDGDQLAVARIPAQWIEILPAAADPFALPVPPASAAPPAESAAATVLWRRLALGLAALWLLTLLAWVWSRLRSSPGACAVDPSSEGADSPAPARLRLRAALAAGDLAQIEHALLGAAAMLCPDSPPRSLAALAERLDNGAQRELLAQLQAARYAAAGGDPGLPSRLRAGFGAGLRLRAAPARAPVSLPPLYPGP